MPKKLWVDSHCHLNLIDVDSLGTRVETLLQDAREQGVAHFLNVSVDLDSVAHVIDTAQQHEGVWASAGLHPAHESLSEPDEDALMHWVQQPKVVAVGETGLDYYHTEVPVPLQQERFRRHIRVARAVQKPLIIHTRDADDDTIRLLREERAHEIGGVFHCFTREWSVAKQALDLGFMISFSGIVTFKNAEPLRQCVREVPVSRLLVETDSPYLAPVPMRGRINQPQYVRFVGEAVAALHQRTVEEIAECTTQNFFTLFSCS